MRGGSGFPGFFLVSAACAASTLAATEPMRARAAAPSRSTMRQCSPAARARRSAATSSSSMSRPIASSLRAAGLKAPTASAGRVTCARSSVNRPNVRATASTAIPRRRWPAKSSSTATPTPSSPRSGGEPNSDSGRLCRRGDSPKRSAARARGQDPWRRLPAGAWVRSRLWGYGPAPPGRRLEALSAIWLERARHLPRPIGPRQPLLRARPRAQREDGRGAQGRAAARPGYELSSPRDMGPAAAANPDLTFLVYHGGFEGGKVEGPTIPGPARRRPADQVASGCGPPGATGAISTPRSARSGATS